MFLNSCSPTFPEPCTLTFIYSAVMKCQNRSRYSKIAFLLGSVEMFSQSKGTYSFLRLKLVHLVNLCELCMGVLLALWVHMEVTVTTG